MAIQKAKKTKEEQKNRKVPEKKIRMLGEIKNLVNTKETLIISSAMNIPSSQLQKIRGNLKGKATMKVVKKQIMIKAIDEISKTKSAVNGLKEYITESSILLFSDISPFELAAILSEGKTPKKAKAGQLAPMDIEVEAGPTDMPAGPMISELSSVGLKVGVENGKISIKESSVIVKKGGKISDVVASTLIKLGIFPFKVGLETLVAYDCKNDKVYVGIKIDREETGKQIKEAVSSSRSLAFSINYPAKEIISLLLAKAVAHAKAIEKLSNVQPPASS